MLTVHWNVILMVILITSKANALTPNVFCGPHISYVETDRYHRYFPHVVELHRCAGRDSHRVNYGCEPTDFKYVTMMVRENTQFINLKLKNITSCNEVCSINETSCNPYQKLDNTECKCRCVQQGRPAMCQSPFHWDQGRCDCICPREPSAHACEKGKVFSKDFCGCICKKRFLKRCKKEGKVLNPDNCLCTDNPFTGKSSKDCSTEGISGAVVAVIVIAEFLLIIFLYILLKRFCDNPEILFQRCFSKTVNAPKCKNKDDMPMVET